MNHSVGNYPLLFEPAHIGHATSEPIFGVSDQLRLKPTCAKLQRLSRCNETVHEANLAIQ